MKTKVLLLFLIFCVAFVWNCKKNTGSAKTKIEESEQLIETFHELPAIIKELAKFAELTFTDTTNINELMVFKEVDANGSITGITMNRAVDLYKKMMKGKQVTSLPIFEIKDTDTAILPIQGVGFGGPIWAKVLLDKKTLEIKKIAFEHKAESEGYGAAFAQSAFENQFIGTKLNLEQNTFNLQKKVEKIRDSGHFIDGISGATMTSQGAIEMVNMGLQKYKAYLSQ